MSEESICAITPPNSPFGHSVVNSEDLEVDSSNTKKIISFRWFSCIGEAKLDKFIVSEDSYLNNNELLLFEDDQYSLHHFEPKNINLFNEPYDFGSVFLEDCSSVFRMARSEMMYLQDATKLNNTNMPTYSNLQNTHNHITARRNCVEMFLYIREYLNGAINYYQTQPTLVPALEKHLSKFRVFLRRITSLPEYVLHHAAHTHGHKRLEASYHLFHGTLDMMWLHLCTLYQLDRCRRVMEDRTASSQQSEDGYSGQGMMLEESVVALVTDLVQLAIMRFEKFEMRDLLTKSPFNCQCVAEVWVLLISFTNKLQSTGLHEGFWSIVTKVLEYVKEDQREGRTNCKALTLSVTRSCRNGNAFTLWLAKHLAMLQAEHDKSASSAYQLLETAVKRILSSELPEAHMRIYLTLIEKIIIKYWEPKSDVIILLWEHFQKRLNSTFFVPGSSVESMAIMSKSVSGMVKQVKSRLANHCEDSFQMFLRIIGLYLQRVTGQSQHWKQIRGRIYSKLSASKMQSLNEVGLYHISSLFLTLAITSDVHMAEVCKKLQSLLGFLSEADMELGARRLVWRTHLSVCLLFAERGLDFTPFVSPLTSALDTKISHELIQTYVDGVKDILDTCPATKINHNLLLGNWITQYLEDCSPNDAVRLLELIQTMSVKVQTQPFEQGLFQKRLWQLLATHLRLKVCEDSPLQLADTSLNLCLLCHQGGETLRDITHLFLNNNAANIGLVRRFLSLLVEQKDLLEHLNRTSSGSVDSCDVLIIKAWIRCSLVCLDCKSSELTKVTNYIAYLPFVSDVCMDLPSATDPLKHFVVAVSNKYMTAKDLLEKCSLRKRMACYFTGLDKWLEMYFKETKNQAIIVRIYHVVGLIVSLMPSFIYVKSHPTTVLKGLLDLMLLPMKAYKPHFEPSPQLKAVISTDIHLYIKGLSCLVVMKDAYIERCIEDLVRIYLPWASATTLHECVERTGPAARLVLTATCSSFLKRKASSPHPHCSQALRFLKSVVQTYSRELDVILQLVDCCFEPLCDVLMFCDEIHPCKSIARSMVISLFECHSFNNTICDNIIQKFENLCREHMAFMPGKLFNLFHEVIRHRPELVLRFLPSLLDHIRTVETKRGINYDHSLRAYSEKLEKALDCLRKGL